jgi:hypothetical protein
MKTSELTGAALDWAVTQMEHPEYSKGVTVEYSSEWDYGGPIIEREKLELAWFNNAWCCSTSRSCDLYYGPTPLIAAMRCYVASKLGDEMDVPEALL